LLILVVFLVMVTLALSAISVKLFAATVIPTLECFPPRFGVTIIIYSVAFTRVNECGIIVPFGGWDVSQVTNMSSMFYLGIKFNQNIGDWDVSKVTNMAYMLHTTTIFNQNIGSWDVCIAFVKLETSQLPMSWLKTLVFQNIHAIVVTLLTSQLPIFWLKAWAKLDTTAGESAIQNNVGWSIANYTDATARQYLIDTYHWTISGGSFDGSKTILIGIISYQ
jgi:surface protein